MLLRRSLVCFGLAFALAACPSEDTADESASLVVGVQAEDFGAIVGTVRIVVKKEGVSAVDEVLPASPKLVKEYEVRGPEGGRVEVEAQALATTDQTPIVTRRATARLVAGAKKLLRVPLERRCARVPASGAAPAFGIECAAPTTCVAGACGSPETPLEDWGEDWGSAAPDDCRPANHGAPEVVLGTGQTGYAPLADGQVLQLEKGPQGGHHIWIGARMKNLRQTGSMTSLRATIVGDPEPVPNTAFIFAFERSEGSYCAISGLRYQIDAGAADLRTAYRRFLGKQLAVTVEVKDTTGASASDTRTVQIADTLLCYDGTNACNEP